MLRGLLLTVVLSALAAPASANDTMAELGTGGLTYVRSDVVQMQSEDLFISPDEVRVAYVFKNTGDKDIESVVAFPMPDIKADPYEMAAIPDGSSDNFLDFEVEADGKPITPQLDQRVFAAEVDLTDLLKSAGVPLFPYGDAVEAAVAKLPQKVRDEWVARGLLYPEEFDAGQGWQKVWTPVWRLKSTYWWRMNFPAGKEVRVTHRYKPSVGATVATTFFEDGKAGGENYDLYRTKYCMDAAFVRAVEAAAAKTPEKYPPYYENWISYILRTGGNWATSIGSFRLTIDKGSPKNLVSFCGQGVKKTGPTTFEMTATDFYPERDLDILILKPLEQFRDDPAASGDADSTGGDAKATGK
jgi:hypothetical protein